jgi:CBS domain containing-hemolysin-like protein
MKVNIKKSLKWSVSIAVITLVLAAIFSITSNAILGGLNWAYGMLIVLAIVVMGVIFDVVGVASTATDEKPFHAMASEKVKGAKHAILIARNADRVSNFCNDVIGDISGIVSGTAAAIVVLELAVSLGEGEGTPLHTIISVIFTSIVAAITVGGKAFGKSFAINNATQIIFQVGRLLHFFEARLHIKVINDNKKRQNLKRQ